MRKGGVVSRKLMKKMMDKEVPWEKIPEADRKHYIQGEREEWANWTKHGAVEPLSVEESERVRRTAPKGTIFRSRFAYRDKNAAHRTKARPLPIKARSRICVQAQGEKACAEGRVKCDAPTV